MTPVDQILRISVEAWHVFPEGLASLSKVIESTQIFVNHIVVANPLQIRYTERRLKLLFLLICGKCTSSKLEFEIRRFHMNLYVGII